MDDFDLLFNELYNSGNNFICSIEKIENPLSINCNRLLICGMGGSGISGNYITLINQSDIIVEVNKNYRIPKLFSNDFAIVISYSGNTEETIYMIKQLNENKINYCVITSGGKIKDIAISNNKDVFTVPDGLQPRAAFPHIFGTLYGLTMKLLKLPIIDETMKSRIINTYSGLNSNTFIESVKRITNKIIDTTPIIISPYLIESVGIRFRCQMNENSKLFACNFTIPEFSHNGIVGIDGNKGCNQTFIMIHSKYMDNRTLIHYNFYVNDIEEKIKDIIEIKSDQPTFLEEILDLTWQLDYLSIELARVQNINPIEVPSIDLLKKSLSIH